MQRSTYIVKSTPMNEIPWQLCKTYWMEMHTGMRVYKNLEDISGVQSVVAIAKVIDVITYDGGSSKTAIIIVCVVGGFCCLCICLYGYATYVEYKNKQMAMYRPETKNNKVDNEFSSCSDSDAPKEPIVIDGDNADFGMNNNN